MKLMTAMPLVALAACTAQPPPPMIAARAAGSCIDLAQVTARHVAPPSAVIFETTHGVYRAEIVGNCAAAAHPNGSEIVQTESQSSHVCPDDRVRIYDPVEAKATGATAFPQCRIGTITTVSAS
jgi:hypothetical protein